MFSAHQDPLCSLYARRRQCRRADLRHTSGWGQSSAAQRAGSASGVSRADAGPGARRPTSPSTSSLLRRACSSPGAWRFFPTARILVTEKPRTAADRGHGREALRPVAGLPAVDGRGQGGLLDVALDPNFATNHLVYWSYAEPRDGGMNNTAVARGTSRGGRSAEARGRAGDLSPDAVAQLAAALRRPAGLRARRHAVHHAWGSARSRKGACRRSGWTDCSARSSRINPDGSIPKDNPFVGKEGVSGRRSGRSVTATCRRATLNPDTGELWSVEHGTRGGDEINIPRKGKDYGWPTIAYGIEYQGGPITGGITAKEGMEQPIYYWDPVIAPSGMAFYTGDLFPGVEGQPVHRRAREPEPRPPDDQGGARGRRGTIAHRPAATRTDPRRRPGTGRRPVSPDRQRGRPRFEAGAEAVEAVSETRRSLPGASERGEFEGRSPSNKTSDRPIGAGP